MSANRRRALGRGLNALIPESKSSTPTKEDTKRVPIIDIEPLSDQPRRVFKKEELAELADSISQNGVLQPLLVRKAKNGYGLIAGERRLRASQLAGKDTVPVMVLEVSEEEAYGLALVENLQREDLNTMEVAQAYQRLSNDFGMTQEAIAERVGKDRASVANYLRILKLPPKVRELIEDDTLSFGHARTLAALTPKQMEQLNWSRLKEGGMSVRELEKRVKDIRNKENVEAAEDTASTEKKDTPSVQALYVQERLERRLGLRVKLRQGTGGKGKIEFAYDNLDELQKLLEKLGVSG